MGSITGNRLKLSIFGESHGPGIGMVLDGLPAGLRVDTEMLRADMARRAPKTGGGSTARREGDAFEFLSGVLDEKTTGTPVSALIRNADARSSDYEELRRIPRPGHADYTGLLRYAGHGDVRGGGHFSGRLTAPLVLAGALCRQYLALRDVTVGAHILSVGGLYDDPFDPCMRDASALLAVRDKEFPTLSDEAGVHFKTLIENARKDGDSVGGILQCAAFGMPAGLGSPMFGGVEQTLSALLFSIPAVKGVEFGTGFGFSELRGSEAGDEYRIEESSVRCATNHNGGILGGITNGMPILFCVAVKPTASIAKPRRSVDLGTMQPAELTVQGRHDACILPRAVPVVEAAAAVGLTELMLEAYGYDNIT